MIFQVDGVECSKKISYPQEKMRAGTHLKHKTVPSYILACKCIRPDVHSRNSVVEFGNTSVTGCWPYAFK